MTKETQDQLNIKVHLNKLDIIKGEGDDPQKCAIARRLEIMGFDHPEVDAIEIAVFKNGKRYSAMHLSKSIKNFIHEFDNYKSYLESYKCNMEDYKADLKDYKTDPKMFSDRPNKLDYSIDKSQIKRPAPISFSLTLKAK